MNQKIKLFAAASLLCLGTMSMKANNSSDDSSRPHSFRISYSDGLTLSGSSFWGMGLSDALLGTKRSDERTTGVYGIGYRYALKRLNLGVDLGFATVKSKTTYTGDASPSIEEKELNLLVLPTAELVYFKRSLFSLYGSAAAGMNFNRRSEKGLTAMGRENALKDSHFSQEFAYQVNPIGVRIGNKYIGGFIEGGIGYKGFVTAGLSFNF